MTSWWARQIMSMSLAALNWATTSLPNRYPAPLGLTPQPVVSACAQTDNHLHIWCQNHTVHNHLIQLGFLLSCHPPTLFYSISPLSYARTLGACCCRKTHQWQGGVMQQCHSYYSLANYIFKYCLVSHRIWFFSNHGCFSNLFILHVFFYSFTVPVNSVEHPQED